MSEPTRHALDMADGLVRKATGCVAMWRSGHKPRCMCSPLCVAVAHMTAAARILNAEAKKLPLAIPGRGRRGKKFEV